MEGKENRRKKNVLYMLIMLVSTPSILQRNASFLSYLFPERLPKRAVQRAWSATNPISPILSDNTRGRLDADLQESSVFLDVILSPFVEKGRGCSLSPKPEKRQDRPRWSSVKTGKTAQKSPYCGLSRLADLPFGYQSRKPDTGSECVVC